MPTRHCPVCSPHILLRGRGTRVAAPFSIRKDIKRRKELRYGRRLKGPILVTARQFTKAGDGIGITTNDDKRPQIAPDGGISLKLEDERTIEFNAAMHPHFEYSYAVSSYGAQGVTADRVLINADTAAHPELLNARFAYVSVSRARLDAEIYTSDAEALSPRPSANTDKSSAIELSRSGDISAAKELGMGESI
jgi:hypothetical protein